MNLRNYPLPRTTDLSSVAGAVNEVINTLDKLAPDTRATALCIAFILVCEKHAWHPGELYTTAHKMMAEAPAQDIPEFEALRRYIANEDVGTTPRKRSLIEG